MSASQQLELHARVPNLAAVTDDEIQASEAWPDKEFLEKLLRNWLKDPDITIQDFVSRIATNKGDNYSSDMFRVTIKCEKREDPQTIIIKRIITTGFGGEMLSKSSLFVREEMMLSTVLPEMYSALKKALTDVEPFGASYVYSVPGVLAMEDLCQSGFRMTERRRTGLDRAHCSLVLRTLARYHAAGVYLMEQKYVNFSLFKKSFYGEDCVREATENAFNGMLRALSEEIKYMDGLEKYSAKLSKLAKEKFLPYLESAIESHEEGDLLVLSHGDLWVNNILFRYSSSGEVEGVRFVDLQTSTITSPCIDLHYFLTTSCDVTVRTTCIEQLFEEYHQTLCETMAALECSTRPPSIEKLRQDFDKRTHHGIYSAVYIMPIVLAGPGEYVWNDIIDTGKPQKELFRNKAYKKVLEWFLPIYESKGFL